MQNIKKLFFTKPDTKIFKGFGPAFLVIALGIGSGEFILWPFLSAHYGFGILWGALLGISLQLLMIVVMERQTAFLGETTLVSFTRVFRYAFWWVLVSTIIGFGWPGFSAMSSQLLVQGLGLPISELYVGAGILVLATLILGFGKSAYKNILWVQKINMSFLLLLTIFLFFYYFDWQILITMFTGLIGMGEGYWFIPAGISLVTFLGAIAYAGSGGNLLLINSFYVEQEKKGLVAKRLPVDDMMVPDETSVPNTKLFTRLSWKQNGLFFWGTGLCIILLLTYISYAVLYGTGTVPENFTFLIQEARIFMRDIHPWVGWSFIITGAVALFGVQMGILDFIGRIASYKNSIHTHVFQHKKRNNYRKGIIVSALFGLCVLAVGVHQPHTLILIGSTINALSMGCIAWLLYRVETSLLPPYIRSYPLRVGLLVATVLYVVFFGYVVAKTFLI